MYTFLTGGLRSGRSSYALRRASELGPPPWLYLTPGEETDEAVSKRISHHRRDKEAIWRTSTLPADLTTIFATDLAEGVGAIVIDGMVSWIAQQLEAGVTEPALLAKAGDLGERFYRSRVPLVVVSTEMNVAVLPESPAQQRLVHTAASANQIFASMAGAVVLMVSGVPLRVR